MRRGAQGRSRLCRLETRSVRRAGSATLSKSSARILSRRADIEVVEVALEETSWHATEGGSIGVLAGRDDGRRDEQEDFRLGRAHACAAEEAPYEWDVD